MNELKQLNEAIEEALDLRTDVPSLINSMKNLKGKYFCGTCLDKNRDVYAEVFDDLYKPYDEDSELYADYTEINLDMNFNEDEETKWLEWTIWANHRNEFEGEGYKFSDYTMQAHLEDYDVYKKRKEQPLLESGLFITLYINPAKFNGDFSKVAKDMDNYILEYKKKFDEIKRK